MPNWVTNRLEIVNDSEKVLQKIKGYNEENNEEVAMDFTKIIPRPKCLNIESGSSGSFGLKIFSKLMELEDFKNEPNHKIISKYMKNRYKYSDALKGINLFNFNVDNCEPKKLRSILELGRKYHNNIKKYGHETWYGWCIDNWGTKWNACESQAYGNTLWFNTAWSAPIPVLTALSKMFPKVEFIHTYADEDIGYNVGQFTYINGDVIGNSIEGGTRDAFEIAFELNCCEEDYVWDEENQTYVYNEVEFDE